MFKMKKNTLTKEFTYDDTVILTYNIEYLELTSSNTTEAIKKFNLYQKNYALSYMQYAQEELFPASIEQYHYNSANGYPIMVYELLIVPTVTYFDASLISFYSDVYTYTGGAHGSTLRTSQNWNLLESCMFPLCCLFSQEDYLLTILKEIHHQIVEQIKNGSNQYFDNFCELVLNTFNMHQFYFTRDFVIVYFQQYDIAPYSSGIPTFSIPRT